MSHQPEPESDSEQSITEQMLQQYLVLFSQQKWAEWIELWADDGVLEFPFAPPGRRDRYVGKVEILAYMQPLGGRMQVDELTSFRVRPMLDPTTICLEMGVKGRVVATGAVYDQRYVSIVEMADGKICHFTEYWNPIVSMDANGGRDAWTAAFGSPAELGATS